MHLYIATRGIKDRVDRLINDLAARYYPYKAGEVAGKPVIGSMQLSVRPLQFWELVFPEEALEEVCWVLHPDGGYGLQESTPRKLKKFF